MISWNIVSALITAFVGGVVFGLCIYADFFSSRGGSDDEHT